MRAFIRVNGKKKLVGQILKGILFVLIFCVLFFAAQRLLQAKWFNTDTSYWIEYRSLEEDSVDVLFMGTSLSYSGIDPMYLYEETGIVSYVLGSGGLRFDLCYAALQEALKTQHPSVLMLDMSAIHYRKQLRESKLHLMLDQLPLSWSKLQFVLDSDSEDLTFLDAMFPFFRYHSRWDELTEEDFQYLIGDTDKTYTRGHYVSYKIVPAQMQFYEESKQNKSAVTKRVRTYLEKIAALCEEEGIELILYKIPSPDWTEIRSEQAAALAEEMNLTFWDLTYELDEIGIDPSTDYRDDVKHLNQYGSEKFSRYMGTYLRENYDFADQRGKNPRWDEDLIHYQEVLAAKAEEEAEAD